MRHSENTVLEGIVSTKKFSYNKICKISLSRPESIFYGMSVYLEMEYINHDYSLRFSLKITGDEDDYQGNNACLVIKEPLSVSYI